MRDLLFELIAPLMFAGAGGGLLLATVAPWMFPSFKRPFVSAWLVSSLGIGGALFADHVAMERGSIWGAIGSALMACAGLALIVPLIWHRIHMWDRLAAAEERRQEAERNARYRAKDFAE